MLISDTIAAISTPLGEGGIGIVRLSGAESLGICQKIFKDNKGIPLRERQSHTLHHGFIVDLKSGETLDEVMVSILRAPNTYTTEDVVEINAHGGILVVQRILQLVLREGARLADAGEFTKRAYLNGRMDLAQAEAVVDLIRSQTDLAERCAVHQLTGVLSKELNGIADSLLDVLVELEAHIDFPEEDLPEHTNQSMQERIMEMQNRIALLLESSKFGKAIREGVRATIVGKPNVGKSSLLNVLLNEQRAIVTPLPGTTRDTITESVNISGIPFLFTDTAGWRETEDIIEKEGVRRTASAINQSDLIVFVLDGSKLLTEEDETVIQETQDILKKQKNPISMIVAINKSDLSKQLDLKQIQSQLNGFIIISISALTGLGIEELKKSLIDMVNDGHVLDTTSGLVVTNVRHTELLRKTTCILEQVIMGLRNKIEPECLSTDLREAMHHLGEITGVNVTEDLLNRIFSRFCIGK